MTDRVNTPGRRGRGTKVAAWTVGGLLVATGAAYGAGYALAGENLPRNAVVEGVPVGGLTRADAEARLRAELEPRAGAEVTLAAGDEKLTLPPAELGLAVDWAASVAQAGGERSLDPRDILDTLIGGSAHEAIVVRDEALLAAAAAELAEKADAEPSDAKLAFDGAKPVVTEGEDGREVDTAATADAVAAAYLDTTDVDAVVRTTEPAVTTAEAEQARDEVAAPAVSEPVTVKAGSKSFRISPAMIAKSLSFETTDDGALEPKLDGKVLLKEASTVMKGLGLKSPRDASFRFANGKPTIVPSVDGLGVSAGDLVKAVEPALTKTSGRSVEVPVTEQKAEFTTADAKKLGVKEVTGSFTTYYPGSAYRVNNIGKAARRINGTFLKPGETFSMNQVLGYRSTANGWMEGGAIDGGQVVTRMGGGISQATTTTFNAIFFAGLKDIYHKPHSLYFSRYPMGREATLDWNSVDMKFQNDTPYGVLMQAWTTGRTGTQGSITVRVWSTKQYDVKATAPVKSNVRNPGPARKSTAKDCVPQSAMQGFDVNYKRLFYKNGKLVKSEPFFWRYNTLTPVVCT